MSHQVAPIYITPAGLSRPSATDHNTHQPNHQPIISARLSRRVPLSNSRYRDIANIAPPSPHEFPDREHVIHQVAPIYITPAGLSRPSATDHNTYQPNHQPIISAGLSRRVPLSKSRYRDIANIAPPSPHEFPDREHVSHQVAPIYIAPAGLSRPSATDHNTHQPIHQPIISARLSRPHRAHGQYMLIHSGACGHYAETYWLCRHRTNTIYGETNADHVDSID